MLPTRVRAAASLFALGSGLIATVVLAWDGESQIQTILKVDKGGAGHAAGEEWLAEWLGNAVADFRQRSKMLDTKLFVLHLRSLESVWMPKAWFCFWVGSVLVWNWCGDIHL